MAWVTLYKYPPIEKQLENLNNGLYRSGAAEAHWDNWLTGIVGSLGKLARLESCLTWIIAHLDN